MMKKLISGSIGLALLAVSGAANAAVIDFEDIAGFTNRATFASLGIEGSYKGYQWPTSSADWPSSGSEAPWAVVSNTDGQFSTVGAYSGTQAVWNWNDGSERSIIFDAPTDVNGAYFNVFAAQQDWGAESVQFFGYDALDNLIGSSAVLFLDRDNADPAWQWLEAGLFDVTRLQIISTNDRFSGDGWWAMDDLTLNMTRVPEPAALALLGLGLAGIGAAARRRRQKA